MVAVEAGLWRAGIATRVGALPEVLRGDRLCRRGRRESRSPHRCAAALEIACPALGDASKGRSSASAAGTQSSPATSRSLGRNSDASPGPSDLDPFEPRHRARALLRPVPHPALRRPRPPRRSAFFQSLPPAPTLYSGAVSSTRSPNGERRPPPPPPRPRAVEGPHPARRAPPLPGICWWGTSTVSCAGARALR